MLLILLFARLILGASTESLVKDLEDQLTQCMNILEFTQSFSERLPNLLGNRRRLTTDSKGNGENLDDQVEKSLGDCTTIIEAVNNFYKELEATDVITGADDTCEDQIILNVGGTHFSTTLNTLRSINGTFFDKLSTTCSGDGTCFIDRDPATFEYILDFIRTGDMVVKSANRSLRSQLLEEAEFFELPDELKVYLRFSSLAGIDLSYSEVSWLNNELPENRELGGLLFDTSKDGDTVGTFHARCNSKGPTVTIVETTLGVVFGGFTAMDWSNSAGYVADKDAFLFRLRPTPIKKFEVNTDAGTNAIYRHPSYGPQFGEGFRIYTNCQSNADSYVVDDGAYTGLSGFALNDGHHDFRVKQYALVHAYNRV